MRMVGRLRGLRTLGLGFIKGGAGLEGSKVSSNEWNFSLDLEGKLGLRDEAPVKGREL